MNINIKPLFLVGVTLSLAACGGSGSTATSAISGVTSAAKISSDPQVSTGTAPINDADCTPAECVKVGGFTKPFVEPFGPSAMKAAAAQTAADKAAAAGNPFASLETRKGNLKNPIKMVPQDDRCLRGADGRPTECKPAAGSIALLEDNRILYFNALEGTEDAEFSVFFEAGQVVTNDQTRVLDISGNKGRQASWMQPSPVDGGANPGNNPNRQTLLPAGTIDTGAAGGENNGALFCADLETLADGRVMAVGGTDYYFEPGISRPIAFGVSELEGIRNARIFNPANNVWSQTGLMKNGRWYPSLTTLANGDVFVSSGVTKLVKPIYPSAPFTSGRNVTQTETYDLGCGTWSENGGAAERSLPLYPRQHLLPNGQVFYNAGGQAFNPFGQSYDQALWNITAAYDPVKKLWTDLGYAGLPLRFNKVGLERLGTALNPTNPNAAADLQKTVTGLLGALSQDPAAALTPFLKTGGGNPQAAIMAALGAGFRGSTFSIQMPLRQNPKTGLYDKAEFLTAGGVLGAITASSPGSYVATDLSRIDSVNIDSDQTMSYESRITGSLNQPRWYGTGVLLPTGQVMTFSGANRDEVLLPGTGMAILKSELFDPATETWTPMAIQHNPRTYHNTALLLPDGRVLIGGHSPINTAYLYSINLPGFSPNDGRDPSFEIYSPPYVFGNRAKITSASTNRADHGQPFSVNVDTNGAGEVVEVTLIRRTTLTHIVDADQRSVVLPFSKSGNTLSLQIPTNKAVLPPGPYMLFVITKNSQGQLVPSASTPIRVTGADKVPGQCSAATTH